MQEEKKNLSNWQQNIFHMKCDAADCSKGTKSAPREDGKENCCSSGPCYELGGGLLTEGRQGTHISPEPWCCGTWAAPAQLSYAEVQQGFHREERIPASLLILVMDYLFLLC